MQTGEMRAWSTSDPGVLHALGDRLDTLHAKTDAPVTARRPWLQAWLEAYREFTPLVFGLDAEDGTLAAVALLATRRRGGITWIVPIGHGPSDTVTASALDEDSAEQLADAIAEHLAARRSWQLLVRNTHAADPVIPRLAARLRHARLVEGHVSPVLRATSGPSLDRYVSSSHRRGINRLRNRMRREGLEPVVRHLHEPEEIREVLPEVERVHQVRDHDLGRVSAMDHLADRQFFRTMLDALSARGEVCLTTLWFGDALAAYVLCFVDGEVRRMWNPRFDPAYARFSPGKVAMEESVAHALATGAAAYDFMRGEERYKSSYANAEERAVELLAASNRLLSWADAAYLAVRARLREMEGSSGVPGRLAEAARRARLRLRS